MHAFSFTSMYITLMVYPFFSYGTPHVYTCPYGNLWHQRASMLCDDHDKYHCLIDTSIVNRDAGEFVEKCLEPRHYIGKRYVFSGDINALDCRKSRYTPGPIWSYNTRDSECPFLKSLCNEEGQVVVEQGTTKKDRSCQCNYRMGYNYVKKPREPCRCYPMKEDCSCYVHQCPKSTQVLSPDYECVEKEMLLFYTCDTIPDERENIPKVEHEDINGIISPTVEKQSVTWNNNAVAWVIVSCIITLTIIFIGVIFFQRVCIVKKTIIIDKPVAVYKGSSIKLSVRMNRALHVRRVYWSHWSVKDENWSKIYYESCQKYEGTVDILPSLRISDVTASDSGSYQCTIQFDDFTKSTCSTNLMVPEDPPITIEKPTRVYRGGCINLTIKMTSTQRFRRVYWYYWNVKDEKWSKIDYESCQKYEGTVDILPSLRINDVTASDSGSYQCRIQFDAFAESTCSTDLTVPEEMFISKTPVVWHYIRTKQLQEMKDAFDRTSGQNLVILQGLHGSGKTQAGNKYCMEVKDEFSVVAKIHFKKNSTFKETLEILAREMNIKLTYKPEVTASVIVNDIKEYLNHKDRSGSPYLLFVDNIDYDTLDNYDDINLLVSLLDYVPALKIIMATTNQKVVENLSNLNYSLIKFQGMDEDEIYDLFSDVRTSKDDIDKLVKVVGTIPLVLVSAIRLIFTSKISLNKYCENFRENSNLLFEENEDNTAMDYDKSVFQSQLIPLTFIQEQLEEKEWEVVTLMPFFYYDSISETVLESCYYHLTRCSPQKSKSAVDRIVDAFTNVSMGQIESFTSPRTTVPNDNSSKTEEEYENNAVPREKVLYFHKITMKALDAMCKNKNENNKRERLLFLLKMFCSEIDTDAGSDKIVSRNLLFVNHANKLLNIIQKELDGGLAFKKPKQVKFYMSFTQCAIGSTLLFEQTEIEKAHKHLIKARLTALDIIEEKSIFLAVNCVYIQDLDHVPAAQIAKECEIDRAIEHVFKIEFSEDFVNDFIVSKRRGRNDIDVIQEELNESSNEKRTLPHYLSRDVYKLLCSKKLALPWKTMSFLLMPELMLRILHKNGRAFDDLSYIVKYDDKGTAYRLLKKASLIEFTNAEILRTKINENFNDISILACKQNELSGRMFKDWCTKSIKIDQLKEAISFYEGLRAKPTETCFTFGVVKMTKNADLRYKSLCLYILLRYYMRQYRMNSDSSIRNEIYGSCRKVMEDIIGKFAEIESVHKSHKWLSLPLLYIQCGKCLLLSPKRSDIKLALKHFEDALTIEQSRGAYWSRFTFRGYKGKISCLRKLNQEAEALETIEKVIHILKGRNRDTIVNQFQDIKVQVKFNVSSQLR